MLVYCWTFLYIYSLKRISLSHRLAWYGIIFTILLPSGMGNSSLEGTLSFQTNLFSCSSFLRNSATSSISFLKIGFHDSVLGNFLLTSIIACWRTPMENPIWPAVFRFSAMYFRLLNSCSALQHETNSCTNQKKSTCKKLLKCPHTRNRR